MAEKEVSKMNEQELLALVTGQTPLAQQRISAYTPPSDATMVPVTPMSGRAPYATLGEPTDVNKLSEQELLSIVNQDFDSSVSATLPNRVKAFAYGVAEMALPGYESPKENYADVNPSARYARTDPFESTVGDLIGFAAGILLNPEGSAGRLGSSGKVISKLIGSEAAQQPALSAGQKAIGALGKYGGKVTDAIGSGVNKFFNSLGKKPGSVGKIVTALDPRQLKNRFTSQTAKKVLLPTVLRADEVQSRLTGTFNREMEQIGLPKMSREEADALVTLHQAGEDTPLRKPFRDALRIVRAAGLDVGDLGETYFPRGYIKPEIKTKMSEEWFALDKEIRQIKDALPDNVDNQIKKVNALIEERLRQKNNPLSVALNHIRKQKPEMSLSEIFSRIPQVTKGGIFRKGSFEFTRQFDLPSSFYENDPRKVLPLYLNDVSRRASESHYFGANGQKLQAMLDQILWEGGSHEQALAMKLMKNYTGVSELEADPAIRSIGRIFAPATMIFKIGAGMTATLANISQTLISTIPQAGAWNTFKGGLKLMTLAGRQQVRASGALVHQDLMHAIAGYRSNSRLDKIADRVLTATGFNGINKINQYVSAAAMDKAIDSWMSLAKGQGVRADWARKRLSDFGLSATKPISENRRLEAMYRFATDTQLQRNLLNDPLAFNDPNLRPLFILKRFGYRQMVMQKDFLKQELLRGNVVPIARLLIGGTAGAAGVVAGTNMLYSFLSGEKSWERPGSIPEEIWDRLAAIGTFGLVSDVMQFQDQFPAEGRLKRALTPVIVSDLERAIETTGKVMKDARAFDDLPLAIKKNEQQILSLFGGIPGSLARRMQTPTQKSDRLQRIRLLEKTAILDMIIDGDSKTAIKRMKLWNENYPAQAFTVDDDINYDAVLKRMKSKYEQKLKAQGVVFPPPKRKKSK